MTCAVARAVTQAELLAARCPGEHREAFGVEMIVPVLEELLAPLLGEGRGYLPRKSSSACLRLSDAGAVRSGSGSSSSIRGTPWLSGDGGSALWRRGAASL